MITNQVGTVMYQVV